VSTTAPKSLPAKRQLSPSVVDDTPSKASNTGVAKPKTPAPRPIVSQLPPRSRLLPAEQQELLQQLSAQPAPARSSTASRGAAAQSPSKQPLQKASATPESGKPPKPTSPAAPAEDQEDSEMAAKKPIQKPKGTGNRRQ
jgi:hypothetical protein